MKIMVVLAALTLPCFLAFSQEADNSGRSVGLSLIPRLDLNPQISVGDKGDDDFTLGNSSFYSLFEGEILDNLSFSLCNHWLSDEPGSLYSNSFRSDDNTWTDWAYLTYTHKSGFGVSLGKMMMDVGGIEYDDYDYDVHPEMASALWNNLACYQWGGKITWTAPSENHTFGLQAVTSPYGKRPFSSGLYSYAASWKGSFNPLETIWSVAAVETEENRYDWIVSIGDRLNFDNLSVSLDYFSKVGDEEDILLKGGTYMAGLNWEASEQIDVVAKAGYEHSSFFDHRFYGAGVHWYPLKGSRDLKVHSVVAYNSAEEILSVNLGVTYYLNIPR